MLVSLADAKTYLGVSSATYDSFLTEQLTVISDAVEGYCGRKFEQAAYVQTFYDDDFENGAYEELPLFHYPVNTIAYVKEIDPDSNAETALTSNIRLHKPTGKIKYLEGYFHNGSKVEVSYNAGFATIPSPIRSVVLSLVEERYNRKISGVALSFGSDVQSIAIPGTISISFDYSLQANERKTAYGLIIGNYVNVLDPYRSERRVTGSIVVGYLD